MRALILAGNWKMNTTVAEGIELYAHIGRGISELKKSAPLAPIDCIVFPPFTHLHPLTNRLIDSLQLGAQNCAMEAKGAYTGEVSADMIASMGVRWVILGHSERRLYFKESGPQLAHKLDLALSCGLRPIFCVGETQAERESGNFLSVITAQLTEAMGHLSARQVSSVAVAYEPVWAIGTGLTASPEQAQAVHLCIRSTFATLFSDNLAGEMTILYGGSLNPKNARELFKQPDIDGGLVGGVSLKPDEFLLVAACLGEVKGQAGQ